MERQNVVDLQAFRCLPTDWAHLRGPRERAVYAAGFWEGVTFGLRLAEEERGLPPEATALLAEARQAARPCRKGGAA